MSPTAKLDPDALAALEEQRDFLLRSLEDLDREHDAGDLTEDDYQALRDDYTARAADVLRAIDEQRAELDGAKRPRNRVRTALVAGGIAAFAVVAGALVASSLGARQAGESSSGGVSVSKTASQRANDCIPKVQQDPAGALECFEQVLDDDPKNPVALTWSAWQLALVAPQVEEPDRTRFSALAAVRLTSAVEADPEYSYARAFRAVVAYRNGRFADAKQYLQDFEDNRPSADALQVIEQMDLEANIDKALAGSTTTTSSTPTTSTTQPG